MDLIVRQSGPHSLVVKPQGRAEFYEEATVRPAQVEVWWRYEDESPLAARLIGRFTPGQKVDFPHTPVGDKNIYLGTVGISASGVKSVRSLRDAAWSLITHQRETDAPTVEQVGPASHTTVTLSIAGYSQFAIKRRIRTADNEAMTLNEASAIEEATSGQPLPVVSYLDRQDVDPGTRTVWVRVSHSSGGEFGDESVAQAFTYADDLGDGASEGEGDPFAGWRFAID